MADAIASLRAELQLILDLSGDLRPEAEKLLNVLEFRGGRRNARCNHRFLCFLPPVD